MREKSDDDHSTDCPRGRGVFTSGQPSRKSATVMQEEFCACHPCVESQRADPVEYCLRRLPADGVAAGPLLSVRCRIGVPE
jgi:hypothetical protein